MNRSAPASTATTAPLEAAVLAAFPYLVGGLLVALPLLLVPGSWDVFATFVIQLAGLVLLGTFGLATVWLDFGRVWKGYVLDICGPAWNYILFRGRFTAWTDSRWTRFFQPMRTFALFAAFLVAVEVAQLLELYDATYDPWDFLSGSREPRRSLPQQRPRRR